MVKENLSLEGKAKALLKRLQRHNRTHALLSEIEIRTVLRQIRIIRTQNLAGYAPHATLERVNHIIEQAVAEAKTILQK